MPVTKLSPIFHYTASVENANQAGFQYSVLTSLPFLGRGNLSAQKKEPALLASFALCFFFFFFFSYSPVLRQNFLLYLFNTKRDHK